MPCFSACFTKSRAAEATAMCVVKFCPLVFRVFMMTIKNNNEKIQMTEAGASVCLFLATALESVAKPRTESLIDNKYLWGLHWLRCRGANQVMEKPNFQRNLGSGPGNYKYPKLKTLGLYAAFSMEQSTPYANSNFLIFQEHLTMNSDPKPKHWGPNVRL